MVSAPSQLLNERAHEHRLWWSPGEHGKGILFECGLVWTWPEGEGDHQHYIDRHFRRTGRRARMLFHVRPSGDVRIPEEHVADAGELTATLKAADGRLRPWTPRTAGATRERPSPHEREVWAMLQRRARSIVA